MSDDLLEKHEPVVVEMAKAYLDTKDSGVYSTEDVATIREAVASSEEEIRA